MQEPLTALHTSLITEVLTDLTVADTSFMYSSEEERNDSPKILTCTQFSEQHEALHRGLSAILYFSLGVLTQSTPLNVMSILA